MRYSAFARHRSSSIWSKILAITAAEQYLIELINRARLDPQAEADRYLGGDLNKGLPTAPLTAASKQVLAGNDLLHAASAAHSIHMLNVNLFEHSGIGDGTPSTRMQAQGYSLIAPSGAGENISLRGTTGTVVLANFIESHHSGLFISSGHRTNILNDSYRELGIGQEAGQFTDAGGTFNSSMLTEKFAYSGNGHFVTGVFYNDANADKFYSMGEGVGGQAVNISSVGTVASAAAGGYSIDFGLTSGQQTLSYAGIQVQLGLAGRNIKLDFVNGSSVFTDTDLTIVSGITHATLLGTSNLSVNGSSGAENLNGNSGNNTINGAGGSDLMTGGAGNDTYAVDNSFDQVVELPGGGSDAVYTSVDLQLAGNVETLILTQNAVQGFGDATNNQIFGNNNVNVLFGQGGDDYLLGLGGDDIFVITPEAGAFDVIGDFQGASVAGGDRIGISGFGAGAQVHQTSQTSFEIRSADNSIVQQFVLQGHNGAALDTGDYYFA